MTITISYINFWNDPYNDKYLSEFIKFNIDPDIKHVNFNNNPDILICSVGKKVALSNIKNTKSKCKLFYYGENLDRYPPYNNYNLLYDIFDLIVGFNETDFSKKQICFPLWLIYYKYYNYDKNNNLLKYIQNKYNINSKKDKKYFASLVSRHDINGVRTMISNELSKYGKIYYGGPFKNNVGNIGNSQQDKINFISNSIYNICPENSKYPKYNTEKIFQALEGGTIPIYWGIDYPEINILNKNKYCFCDIENNNITENIQNVVKHKSEYLEADLFNEDAHIFLKQYYDDLIKGIKIYI